MRFYTADINIGGDRNHVVTKSGITPAEIKVLQAIHGFGSVHSIKAEPSKIDRSSHAEIRDHLQKEYGRTRVDSGGDARPVLVTVFPGWPNVDMPVDAKAASIDPNLIVDDSDEPEGPKPVSRRTYWQSGEELGVTEQGDVLPEGAKPIKKADYEAILAERQAASGDDHDFTE